MDKHELQLGFGGRVQWIRPEREEDGHAWAKPKQRRGRGGGGWWVRWHAIVSRIDVQTVRAVRLIRGTARI
jgi:hypothetical protein